MAVSTTDNSPGTDSAISDTNGRCKRISADNYQLPRAQDAEGNTVPDYVKADGTRTNMSGQWEAYTGPYWLDGDAQHSGSSITKACDWVPFTGFWDNSCTYTYGGGSWSGGSGGSWVHNVAAPPHGTLNCEGSWEWNYDAAENSGGDPCNLDRNGYFDCVDACGSDHSCSDPHPIVEDDNGNCGGGTCIVCDKNLDGPYWDDSDGTQHTVSGKWVKNTFDRQFNPISKNGYECDKVEYTNSGWVITPRSVSVDFDTTTGNRTEFVYCYDDQYCSSCTTPADGWPEDQARASDTLYQQYTDNTACGGGTEYTSQNGGKTYHGDYTSDGSTLTMCEAVASGSGSRDPRHAEISLGYVELVAVTDPVDSNSCDPDDLDNYNLQASTGQEYGDCPEGATNKQNNPPTASQCGEIAPVGQDSTMVRGSGGWRTGSNPGWNSFRERWQNLYYCAPEFEKWQVQSVVYSTVDTSQGSSMGGGNSAMRMEIGNADLLDGGTHTGIYDGTSHTGDIDLNGTNVEDVRNAEGEYAWDTTGITVTPWEYTGGDIPAWIDEHCKDSEGNFLDNCVSPDPMCQCCDEQDDEAAANNS